MYRYLPPGFPAPGERHMPSSSATPHGSARGFRAPHAHAQAAATVPATPGAPATVARGGAAAATGHQQPQAQPQGSVVGSVATGGLDLEAVGEVTVLVGDSGTDTKTWLKDAPCDFITIWLYFPYAQG